LLKNQKLISELGENNGVGMGQLLFFQKLRCRDFFWK